MNYELHFTVKERIVLGLAQMIVEHRRKPIFTLTEICDSFYNGSKRPTHSRSSMSATLRSLEIKTHLKRGCKLVKQSGLGRGKIGVYEFRGSFKGQSK